MNKEISEKEKVIEKIGTVLLPKRFTILSTAEAFVREGFTVSRNFQQVFFSNGILPMEKRVICCDRILETNDKFDLLDVRKMFVPMNISDVLNLIYQSKKKSEIQLRDNGSHNILIVRGFAANLYVHIFKSRHTGWHADVSRYSWSKVCYGELIFSAEV